MDKFIDEGKNIFASTNFRNQAVHFGIKNDDRRRHMYVIGKTGSGKSNLLETMAINDIRAGKGVAVVDPHGEFAEKMLDFIPKNRIDDVIYFNPADMQYPIAFNPLEQVSSEFRHLIASGIMGVFKKIWVDMWSARMEYILNNTLLALLEYPDATILGIMRMFSDPEYRKKIVTNLKDPVIKGFWVNEYARYSQKFETEAVAAIQNKVGQFVSNPLVRNIIGQPRSTINMRKVMDEEKILIANLSKGKIGEDNSRLLGAMLITRIQLAAMSRVDIAEPERKDFFLHVDEFQNFATDSFASILSEARKYHLSLTLAHQYIEQLDEKVRPAVFGNVGTLVCFRVGAEDAEFLEKEFMPQFEATDLVNLEKYNVYLKLLIDGIASHPFSAVTLPPMAAPAENFRDAIIENSRKKYALPIEKVEEKIASDWLEAAQDTARPERKVEKGSLTGQAGYRPGGPSSAGRSPYSNPSPHGERPVSNISREPRNYSSFSQPAPVTRNNFGGDRRVESADSKNQPSSLPVKKPENILPREQASMPKPQLSSQSMPRPQNLSKMSAPGGVLKILSAEPRKSAEEDKREEVRPAASSANLEELRKALSERLKKKES